MGTNDVIQKYHNILLFTYVIIFKMRYSKYITNFLHT